VVRDIHAQYPTVTIDGVAAKQSMGGYQKILMADGTTERLAVYGTIPWLLTIRFRTTTTYKSPRPSFVDVLLTVLVTLATIVAMAVWLSNWRWVNGVTGSVALGVAAGSVKWLRTSEDTTTARLVLLAGTVVMTVAAAVGIMGT
jgi:hypothetical protein